MNKRTIGLAIYMLAFVLAARFSMDFARLPPSSFVVIWLPSGLGVLGCLLWGLRALPLIFGLSLAANLPELAGGGCCLDLMLVQAFIDTAKSLLIWRLCLADLPEGLKSFGDVIKLAILTSFLPTLLPGLVSAVSLALKETFVWTQVPITALILALADTLGILLVLPVYWAWQARQTARSAELPGLGLGTGLLLLLLYFAATDSFHYLYLTIPILVSLCLHAGLRGAVIGQALVLLGITAASTRGIGPFHGADPLETFEHLFLLLGSASISLLAVGAAQGKLALTAGEVSRLSEAQTLALDAEVKCRKRLELELDRMAHVDDLTGLPNRAMLFDRLSQGIAHARRYSLRFALLFADLDGFKEVNDRYGHEVGDQLLVAVAKRLRDCVRESDTVARIGGDEFTIIVRDINFRRNAAMVADKIIAALSEPFRIEGCECRISASIGIAIYPDEGETAELLLSHADSAMYLIKRHGKNGRAFYDADRPEDSA